MIFLSPFYLILLSGLPIAVAYNYWRNRTQIERIRLLNANIGSQTLIQSMYRAKAINFYLRLFIICLLIFALARPSWGIEILPSPTDKSSIMFVLDVSRSMDAEDTLPTRLERAKADLRELLTGLNGVEVGLVEFAGLASIRFPLTTDLQSVHTIISSISTQSISPQGTNLESALELAIEGLTVSSTPYTSIVLMTDGETHDGDWESSLSVLNSKSISLYILGYGDPSGSRIPVQNADASLSYLYDSDGQPVISRLNEAALTHASALTNGAYWRVDAERNYLRSLINIFQAQGLGLTEQGVLTRPAEQYGIFLLLAILLFIIEIGYSDDLIRKQVKPLIKGLLPVLLISLVGCVPESVSRLSLGNELYENGDFARALREYENAQVSEPDNPVLYINGAHTYVRLGRFQSGLDALKVALRLAEGGLEAQIYYDMGNIYYQMGSFNDAIIAYKQSLLLNAGDEDARFNLELAMLRAVEVDSITSPSQASEDLGDNSQEDNVTQPNQIDIASADLVEANNTSEFSVEEAERLLDAIQQSQQTIPVMQGTGMPAPPNNKEW